RRNGYHPFGWLAEFHQIESVVGVRSSRQHEEKNMFHTVLIANRGEIAVRIAKTLRKMGIKSVAIYSDADCNSAHVSACDTAVCLGGNTAAESYLQADKILAIAKQTGAQAIIPGYGFLSENASFCEACEANGIAFC